MKTAKVVLCMQIPYEKKSTQGAWLGSDEEDWLADQSRNADYPKLIYIRNAYYEETSAYKDRYSSQDKEHDDPFDFRGPIDGGRFVTKYYSPDYVRVIERKGRMTLDWERRRVSVAIARCSFYLVTTPFDAVCTSGGVATMALLALMIGG